MRFRKFLFPITVVLFFACVAAAQSTSMSNPTPLNGEYTGKGPSKETSYYFSFTGGPGSVKVALEIKAKDYSTFARLEIGNDPSNLIAMHNMNASTTTGAADVVKEFKLASEQTVRIKLILDSNLAEYKLSVTGDDVGGSGSGSMIGGAKAGPDAKLGKVGSKIGSAGSAGKPKVGTQGSTGGGEKQITVMCPNDVTYQIVPVADWNATLYVKKVLKFDNATVDSGLLHCTYSSGSDSSTLTKKVPVGYSCSVYNSGPKSKIFSCTVGVTAVVTKREGWDLDGR